MAQKKLCEYSAPSATNVPVGLKVSTGGENFEIKTDLIMMVQASPFCGKANEDASAHLQQFLEFCSTFCDQGSVARRDPASSVSVLSFGESEVVVLC